MSELQQKLDRIKAACRLAIELGEKASGGPWIEDSNPRNCGLFGFEHSMGGITPVGQVYDNPDSGLDPIDEEESSFNLALILHARTFSPVAAQALLTAIEQIEKLPHEGLCQTVIGWPKGQPCNCWNSAALASIADQWPDSAL